MGDPVFITIPVVVAASDLKRKHRKILPPSHLKIEVGMRVQYRLDPSIEGVVIEIEDNNGKDYCTIQKDDGELDSYFASGLAPIEQQDFAFTHEPDGMHVSSLMKTAISLPELVRQTNAFSKKYRPGCEPKMLDSNPKALFLHYNVKCNKEDSDPAGHDVRVQFDITKVQESQQAKDLDVHVSCSCPAFLYWGAQWNLHQRDGLEGAPRPKLVAPTERLDLRGNYVICKHIHAVFERILPSVQHNIVKILREREVRRNKEKVKETPSKLKEKQDEMKRKKQLEKIRKVKDKKVRDRMMEALQKEEEARLLHEQQLMNQGAPGEVEPELEEEKEAPTTPSTHTHEPDDDLSAIQDLMKQEEDKIEEAHKEGLPHLHKGLPYDIEPEEEDEDKIMRKFESLNLDRKLATRIQVPGIGTLEEGMDVLALAGGSFIRGRIKKIEKDRERPEFSRVEVVATGESHYGIYRADMIRLPQRRLF